MISTMPAPGAASPALDTGALNRAILNALRRRHAWPEWLFFEEMCVETGFAPQRLDGWTFAPLPGAPAPPPPQLALFSVEAPAPGGLPAPLDDGPTEAEDPFLDAWVQHTYPSERLVRITYEVKVSLSDLARELRNPQKRVAGQALSNLFYFVTPAGLLARRELPAETGWMEYWPTGLLRVRRPAPWRDTPAPPWAFVAAAIRRAWSEPHPAARGG